MPKLTLTQIKKLWNKYQVPENIQKHSQKVTELALDLGQKLKSQGIEINLDLIYNSAMLHDIAKFLCLDCDTRHTYEGARILRKEGLEKEAEIVESHGLDTIIHYPERLNSWENKLVYYADKRVVHDQITSLEEKFKYMRKRYSQHLDVINQSEEKIYKLEKEVFFKSKYQSSNIKSMSKSKWQMSRLCQRLGG